MTTRQPHPSHKWVKGDAIKGLKFICIRCGAHHDEQRGVDPCTNTEEPKVKL